MTIGVALQRPGRLQARALGDQQLRVGPRPRTGQVAELAAGAAVDPQLGQRRSGRHVDRHPGAGLHDDERQPRPQPALRVGRRRGEQPRQIGLVEVDGDEVVRFDVGGVASRREADDRPRVEPDDVARAGQRRRRRGATETAAERHVQLDRRPLGQLAVSGSRAVAQLGDEAAPGERQEAVDGGRAHADRPRSRSTTRSPAARGDLFGQ